jgi:tetratricopeptide (TPR) repeat protein
MLRRLLAGLLLAFAFVWISHPAAAKPTKKDMVLAKQAAQEAKKHEKKKDWEEAREAWQRSVDLNDTPGARIGLARAESELGRLLLAEKHLQEALASPKLPPPVKRKAKLDLAKLEERIPTLAIELPADFGGELWLGDESIGKAAASEPRRLDPGEYQVRAEAKGFQPFREAVVLEEGDRKAVKVTLAPLAAAEPVAAPADEEEQRKKKGGGSAQRTLGWVSLGIGGVGLIVGTVMGLSARSTRSELDGACSNDVCSEGQRDLYNKGKSQANTATAGFIVAGVGIGLGAVLLMTAGDSKEAPQAKVEAVVGVGEVGVRGRF